MHAACDALGNPVRLVLSPGQSADISWAEHLLGTLQAQALVADKGYDSEPFIESLRQRHIEPVIPARSNRRQPRVIDRNLYCDRNKVERFFLRLKQFRRVATRYDKTASSFLAVAQIASIMILLL